MQTLRKKAHVFFRISEVGGALAIIGAPISISLSQAGYFLALIGWALWSLMGPRTETERSALGMEHTWTLRFHFPLPLKFAVGLYAVLSLSLLVNALGAQSPGAFIVRGLGAELKDLMLLPAAFWVLAYSQDERGRARLILFLKICLAVLLISGLIAIFSIFRLGKIPYHLKHGWTATALARFQHHAGTFFLGGRPVHFYMPIGFMGTHLTYAALLGFFFPYLVLRVLDPFVRSPLRFLRRPPLLGVAALTAAGMILILNNGRSAIMGMLVAMGLGVVYFVRVHWGRRVLLLGIPAVAIVLVLAGLYTVSPRVHHRFDKIVASVLGQSKHTDWQRAFVWQGTMDIVARNPVLGIGPGAYKTEINRTIIGFSQQNPRLWYAYELTRRGHAHSDFFHFLTLGGVAAAAFFLAFIGALIMRVFRPSGRLMDDYWKWGALTLFAGSLFQCYLLDDEVLLPFWIMVGTALRMTERHQVDSPSPVGNRTTGGA